MSHSKVSIFEVGPRDGLQNDPRTLSMAFRQKWVSDLVAAGLKDIEVAAFVRPDLVPQMKNTDVLLKKLQGAGKKTTRYWALVPNMKGLDRALVCDAKNIALFTAATESFAKRNIGMSVEQSLKEFQAIKNALPKKIRVRGYVSTAYGCPFEGKVQFKKTMKVVERLLKIGCDQVSVGDTIGVAAPKVVQSTVLQLIKNFGEEKIAMHFHDTRGTALANVWAAMLSGARTFDSSAGGLGGCPFAPGAKGNLATEDLVYLCKESGIQTGVNFDLLCKSSQKLQKALGGARLVSRAYKAWESTHK